MPKARSFLSRRGEGGVPRPVGLWIPSGPPSPSPSKSLGLWCPGSVAPAPCPSSRLAHKDFSQCRQDENDRARHQWWRLCGPQCAGSRRGRAAPPARERQVPGDPGPRARRPERPPPAPPSPRGSSLPPWGGHPARTLRASRVRPRPSAEPRGPSGSPDRERRRVRPLRPRVQRVSGPLGTRLGSPGKKTSGEETGPSGRDPRAQCAPQVRAPRGPRRGRLPLFPDRPGGARAPSPPPRLPPGRGRSAAAGGGERGAGYSRAADPGRGAPRT
jgi:hypothetical protein